MEGVITSLETAFADIGTNLNTVIGEIVPIAVGIVGTVMVVTFGLKMFKKLTGRA